MPSAVQLEYVVQLHIKILLLCLRFVCSLNFYMYLKFTGRYWWPPCCSWVSSCHWIKSFGIFRGRFLVTFSVKKKLIIKNCYSMLCMLSCCRLNLFSSSWALPRWFSLSPRNFCLLKLVSTMYIFFFVFTCTQCKLNFCLFFTIRIGRSLSNKSMSSWIQRLLQKSLQTR